MFTRRALSIIFFLAYWFSAVVNIYHFLYREHVVKNPKYYKRFGRFTLVIAYFAVAILVYIILKRLVLWIYVKTKISEKKTLQKLKERCRDIERGIDNNHNKAKEGSVEGSIEPINEAEDRKANDENGTDEKPWKKSLFAPFVKCRDGIAALVTKKTTTEDNFHATLKNNLNKNNSNKRNNATTSEVYAIGRSQENLLDSDESHDTRRLQGKTNHGANVLYI